MLYDTEQEIYFAARDAIGTRPLYYTIENGQFFYADDMGVLFNNSKIKIELDIESIQMLLHHGSIAYDVTMYKDIKRLPPGCSMLVNKNGNVHIERYWKPEVIEIDESISEENAKEKFLELFDQAIESRIDDISHTSFDLSGGLDSSSVVSMAKQIYPEEKIHTTSKVFGSLPNCDESEYLDAMNDKYDLSINKISIDNLDYQDAYSLEYNYRLDPYWPILVTHTMSFPVAKVLKERGIKRVLTGQGGDQILAGNPYVVFDNLKRFEWIQMYREFKAVKKPIALFKRYILSLLVNEKQKQVIRSTFHLLSFQKRDVNKKKSILKKSFQEFSQRFPKSTVAQWHDLDVLTNTNQSLMFDISPYHVIEKHYGITYTHPFYDRRLMEFILSLPAKFKYKERVTKVLLRKAMKGILPEKIRKRHDKAEFTAVIKQQIDAIDLDALLNDTMLSKLGLIEQSEIDQLKEDYRSDKMKTVAYFWKIINLEYWYRFNFGIHTVKG